MLRLPGYPTLSSNPAIPYQMAIIWLLHPPKPVLQKTFT